MSHGKVLQQTGAFALFVAGFLLRVLYLILCFLWDALHLLLTGSGIHRIIPSKVPEYYRSEHWRKLRRRALRYYSLRCGVCRYDYMWKGKKIFVHHRHYYRNGTSIQYREDIARDLQLLCEDHHMNQSLPFHFCFPF